MLLNPLFDRRPQERFDKPGAEKDPSEFPPNPEIAADPGERDCVSNVIEKVGIPPRIKE
jgi:hypothetical protein